jgi:hypothetical protein
MSEEKWNEEFDELDREQGYPHPREAYLMGRKKREAEIEKIKNENVEHYLEMTRYRRETDEFKIKIAQKDAEIEIHVSLNKKIADEYQKTIAQLKEELKREQVITDEFCSAVAQRKCEV